MTDLGDFDLGRSSYEPGGDGGSRRVILGFAAVVALLAVGAALYFFVYRPRSIAPPAQTPTATEQALPETQPAPSEEMIDLPPLGESDAVARKLARALSSHPKFLAWLATDGVIRTFVVVVDNIASGDTPARHLRFMAPGGRFRVAGREERPYIDPRSYERYNTIADVVASLDAQGCARAYRMIKPLAVAAYKELGHPDGRLDEALAQAIRLLLQTPVAEGQVALTPRIITYAYADDRLEDLNGAQKHLLRMGPRNVRLVQSKLREIASALGVAIRAAGP